jgi:copper transport protein
MRLPWRVAGLASVAGLWLLATGPAAAAHGLLRSSDPAGGATLPRAPETVTLRFSEAPDPDLSFVRVLDTAGRVVAGGAAQPVQGHPQELRVPAAGLPDGSYTVSWRIVSAVDGHRTDGAFAFGVGSAAGRHLQAVQAVAEVRTGQAPAPLGVAGRWAFYWGLTLLVGAAATGLLVFGRRLPGRPAVLLGLALVAAVAGLAAMTAAARADAGLPLSQVLGSTTGSWLLWRAGMLAVAGAATCWLLARPDRTGPLVAVGVAAAGGMGVHALAGHAAGPSSLRLLNLLAQWAHLLAVGVWIGGLAWLLAGLRERAASTRMVVVRFSKLAGISLAVVVATGLARTIDELGGWGRLVDTGFGRALDLKLVLFAGLLLLGALNRYRLVPLLEVGTRRRPVTRLRHSVGGELWLAAAVLLAAALLSELPPGRPAVAGPQRVAPPVLQASGTDYTTTVRVTLIVTPGTAGPNRFTATVADYDTGSTLPAERVELAGSPAARPDLAGARLELVRDADGRWLGQGRLLSLAGRWTLTTTVQSQGGGVLVPLQLDVPAMPELASMKDRERSLSYS